MEKKISLFLVVALVGGSALYAAEKDGGDKLAAIVARLATLEAGNAQLAQQHTEMVGKLARCVTPTTLDEKYMSRTDVMSGFVSRAELAAQEQARERKELDAEARRLAEISRQPAMVTADELNGKVQGALAHLLHLPGADAPDFDLAGALRLALHVGDATAQVLGLEGEDQQALLADLRAKLEAGTAQATDALVEAALRKAFGIADDAELPVGLYQALGLIKDAHRSCAGRAWRALWSKCKCCSGGAGDAGGDNGGAVTE